MAIRALNESYTPVDIGWFSSLKPEARRRLRRGADLSLRAMATEFGVGYDTLRCWETGSALPAGPAGAMYERWLRRALGQDAPEPEAVASL
jgi:DNA-binding transcriptional regulator YiaG